MFRSSGRSLKSNKEPTYTDIRKCWIDFSRCLNLFVHLRIRFYFTYTCFYEWQYEGVFWHNPHSTIYPPLLLLLLAFLLALAPAETRQTVQPLERNKEREHWHLDTAKGVPKLRFNLTQKISTLICLRSECMCVCPTQTELLKVSLTEGQIRFKKHFAPLFHLLNLGGRIHRSECSFGTAWAVCVCTEVKVVFVSVDSDDHIYSFTYRQPQYSNKTHKMAYRKLLW